MARAVDSWYRRMSARLRGARHSPAGRELGMTMLHALEAKAVHAQDAEITAKLLQNVGPLLAALQPTPDALIRAGALLVVKINGVVTVRQLTSAQQLLLDHAPHLEMSPAETLRTLSLAESATISFPTKPMPVEPAGSLHLELVGDGVSQFPELPVPQRYRSARIVHCSYQTLQPLSELTKLVQLEIAAYPDHTLEPIGRLTELEKLSIVHLPLVRDLSPLAYLTKLRRLDLMMLPSFDFDTVLEVTSLSPFCALPKLEEINLVNVRPYDQRVDDLLKCPALRTATLTGYPDLEVERLKQALADRC